MPLQTVPLTDTFDQWRQKTNDMINQVNTLTVSGSIISSSNPTAGQILVYDGSVYRNVSMSGDISINSSGSTAVVGGPSAFSKGRALFMGSVTNLY